MNSTTHAGNFDATHNKDYIGDSNFPWAYIFNKMMFCVPSLELLANIFSRIFPLEGTKTDRRFKDRSRICKLTGSSTDSKWHHSFTSKTIIQHPVDSPTGQTPSLVHILGTASSKQQENVTSPRITRTHFGRLCGFITWVLKDTM